MATYPLVCMQSYCIMCVVWGKVVHHHYNATSCCVHLGIKFYVGSPCLLAIRFHILMLKVIVCLLGYYVSTFLICVLSVRVYPATLCVLYTCKKFYIWESNGHRYTVLTVYQALQMYVLHLLHVFVFFRSLSSHVTSISIS